MCRPRRRHTLHRLWTVARLAPRRLRQQLIQQIGTPIVDEAWPLRLQRHAFAIAALYRWAKALTALFVERLWLRLRKRLLRLARKPAALPGQETYTPKQLGEVANWKG